MNGETLEILVLCLYCVFMLVSFVGLGFFVSDEDEELTHMEETDQPHDPSWR
jgi:hypothetical protein